MKTRGFCKNVLICIAMIAIISVTNSFKRKLIERCITGDKIHVITNGVDLSRFAPLPKDDALATSLGIGGCFVGGYIGTHGMAHGLETILDTAEKFQMRAEPTYDFCYSVMGPARQI